MSLTYAIAKVQILAVLRLPALLYLLQLPALPALPADDGNLCERLAGHHHAAGTSTPVRKAV
jgi:hypothetical protein